MSQKAGVKVPVALVLALLLLSVPIIGASWWLASELGINPFVAGDGDGFWEKPSEGDQSVFRKLEVSLVNKFATTNGSGWSVIIYGSDGETLQEPAITASSAGVATSVKSYNSGEKLVLECSSGNNKIRHHVIVPKMKQADVDAVTNNPFSLDIFTVPDGDVAVSLRLSNGSTVASGGAINKTEFGDTGGITVQLNAPTDGEGYISSYDDIDDLAWNVVLYAKLYNTNYEYVSLTGWTKQYPKGTAEWFAERIPDKGITRYKVGNTYFKDDSGFVWDGSCSFSFSIDLTGYSGDDADIVFYLYAYSDYNYHEPKGSMGPDSYALASTFTLNLVD